MYILPHLTVTGADHSEAARSSFAISHLISSYRTNYSINWWLLHKKHILLESTAADTWILFCSGPHRKLLIILYIYPVARGMCKERLNFYVGDAEETQIIETREGIAIYVTLDYSVLTIGNCKAVGSAVVRPSKITTEELA